MRRFLLLFLLALPFGMTTAARSDVNVPGETGSSLRRLKAVDEELAAGKTAEAVEELRRIVEEAGDDLVPLTPRWSVRARRLCHHRLAALPPAALKVYREKVDPAARKWLDQGEADRDARLLRKVVDEAFCSRSGDRALDLLGDLAFERSDFDAAERWWLAIVPPTPSDGKPAGAEPPDALLFPDPQVDVARVRAKQLLARTYRGEREGLPEALAAFRASHAGASGDLAGHKGVYADVLKDLLALPVEPLEDWPTFAGASSRNRLLEQAPGKPSWRIPQKGPTWARRLDGQPVQGEGSAVKPDARAAALAFHPVIVGDQVFIADGRYVRAFNLYSGEHRLWFDLLTDGQADDPDLGARVPVPRDLSHSLTAAGDRLFVRLGAAVVAVPEEPAAGAKRKGTLATYVVCLDVRVPRRPLWMAKANRTDTTNETFEGAPLVHEGRAYVAAVRFEGGNAITSITCYDAATGGLRWRKPVDVCETDDDKTPRRRHHLLTRAGSHLVYCSHSGVVVALEAETGKRSWAVRYPSRGLRTDDGLPSPRELAPPVYAGNRVFVAPLDYGRVVCLDPDSGRTLWESEPAVETVHLLGVSGGRLILTTPNDARALDAATGRTLRNWMFPFDGIRLPSYGRGLLAGGWVYWPTTAGLYLLDQKTGDRVDDPAAPFSQVPNDVRGNLAASAGCLVVADAGKIYAFVSQRHFLEERRKESRDDHSPAARVRLALAEADAGRTSAALAELVEVEKDAGAQAVPARTLIRRLRHDVLLRQAESDVAARRWDNAAASLTVAAGKDFAFTDRIQALTRLAAVWSDAGKPASTLEAWQEVLTACAARREQLKDPASYLPRARAAAFARHAEREIDVLLQKHGRQVYETIERRAQALLKQEGDSLEALEKAAAIYPNAIVTGRRVLPPLAATGRRGPRPALEAECCRRLLRHQPRDPADLDRAANLKSLATLYEEEHCWRAARDVWQQLATEYGDRIVAKLDARPVKDYVAAHLKSVEPYRQLDASERPALTLPLVRAWEIPLSGAGERLLIPEGSGEDDNLFFAAGRGAATTLTCRDVATGRTLWQHAFPHGLTWLGRHLDLLVAAGPEGIHGLRLGDGSSAWDWAGEPTLASVPPLAQFRLSGGRLFFFEDDRRLVALDGETGARLWSLWSPGGRLQTVAQSGRFYPRFHAGDRRLALQLTGRLWIVDAQSGQRLHDLPTAVEPWPRDPVPLDDRRLCLVPDSTHVVLLDLEAGQVVWQHAKRKPSLTGTAPLLKCDGRALIAMLDGWILERLDPRTGEPTWAHANAHWAQHSATPAALDSDAAYVLTNHVLSAHSLTDGKERWTAALPGNAGPWRVVRTRDQIVVFPSEAAVSRSRPSVLGAYLLALPPAAAGRSFPVTIWDPAAGQLIERLPFYQFGAPGHVQLLGGRAVVAVAGKAWGLGPRSR